ncbi:MAG: DCC1-like thiol-disulfide oxidoreductase family protein [Nitrospira sp.]|nr:DCC1-like thiol-disulfide oxidoreductase family protein [Nitrospira sp.]
MRPETPSGHFFPMKQGQGIGIPTEWRGHERIILFDGVCRWCQKWVEAVIRHDRLERFKFAPLQSAPAQRLLMDLALPTHDFESFLLVEQGRIYSKSTAALRIAKQLFPPVSFLYLCILIPRPLRDAAYYYIARRRYRWMVTTETCTLPAVTLQNRFI